jgi:hypothetical protein
MGIDQNAAKMQADAKAKAVAVDAARLKAAAIASAKTTTTGGGSGGGATSSTKTGTAYLNNLAAGKNPDGSAATAGNIAWAKAQGGNAANVIKPATTVIPGGSPVINPGVVQKPGTLTPGVVNSANPAGLMGAAQLAKLYGITTDRNTIQGIYDQATNAQFALQEKQQQQINNQFYDQMFASGETAKDLVRKSNAAAVATGASRGMAAAQEMSAMLMNSKDNAAGATLNAQNSSLLGDKKTAALAQNVMNALTAAQTAGMGLAGVDMNKYAADTQYGVGALDSNSRNYTADQGLVGTNNMAAANIEAARIAGEANVKAAGVSASAYAGGSYGGGTSSSGNPAADFKNYFANGDDQSAAIVLMQMSGGSLNMPDALKQVQQMRASALLTDKQKAGGASRNTNPNAIVTPTGTYYLSAGMPGYVKP